MWTITATQRHGCASIASCTLNDFTPSWELTGDSLFWLLPVLPHLFALFMLIYSSLTAKVKYDRGTTNVQHRHCYPRWRQCLSEVQWLLSREFTPSLRMHSPPAMSAGTVTGASTPFSNVLSHLEVRNIHRGKEKKKALNTKKQ